ncbi:MAG: OmpA family protein [Bacteroidota bacterium]
MVRVKIVGLIFIMLFSIDLSVAQKQSKYQKANKKKYKRKYRGSLKPNMQCFQLFKNKYKVKNKKVAVRGKKSNSLPLAEFDPTDIAPPKPRPQTQPEIQTVEEKEDFRNKPPEEHTPDENQLMENEVFVENNLPIPTSQKQEEIRQLVKNKLKENEAPIKLDPLYFTLEGSEFAFVDIDPFLIAVEYRLQGRVVLIEGHTNDSEQDHNVKLSIQRVEKVRQLMQDMGVPDDRISVVGYGKGLVKNDNRVNEIHPKNRRVDFTIY